MQLTGLGRGALATLGFVVFFCMALQLWIVATFSLLSLVGGADVIVLSSGEPVVGEFLSGGAPPPPTNHQIRVCRHFGTVVRARTRVRQKPSRESLPTGAAETAATSPSLSPPLLLNHCRSPAGSKTYHFDLPADSASDVEIVVTPVSGGNPDLCISQTTTRPSPTTSSCHWSGDGNGADLVHIIASELDLSKPLYVGVRIASMAHPPLPR